MINKRINKTLIAKENIIQKNLKNYYYHLNLIRFMIESYLLLIEITKI